MSKYSPVMKTQQGQGWSIRYRDGVDANNEPISNELDLLKLKNYILEYVETMNSAQLLHLKFDINWAASDPNKKAN